MAPSIIFLRLLCTVVFSFLLFDPALASHGQPKYLMYLTGQHPIVPNLDQVKHVTHVALAFIRSEVFNEPPGSSSSSLSSVTSWPLFTTVDEVRPKFSQGTKFLVAIGGWGNTEGFSEAAKSEESRELFARNVARMVEGLGADGVDIDWEYPGGNGEDYKSNPNPSKAWEIPAYPLLLSTLRTHLGPTKLLTAAVPGLPRDMLAFTHTTIPQIMKSVDFLNIMTYDLMNRRDNITKHHTGLQNSLDGIDAYLERGLEPQKALLGLAFYVKWFRTAPDVDCTPNPLGCKTALLEDPNTGGDLGRTGAFSWHDDVPSELSASFNRAMRFGRYYDEQYGGGGGGHGYWDQEERLWWSWDTAEVIASKFGDIVERKGLGGVFAWGLGEDAEGFEHLRAANEGVEGLLRRGLGVDYGGRDEL